MTHSTISSPPDSPRARHRGFTLIEVMITVAIIAILTAIALPSYRDYVVRGYLVDATSLLTSYQAQMERYYQDNRTYASTGSGNSLTTPPCSVSPAPQQGKFALSCNLTTPTNGYTLTATGSGPVAGFVYTLTSQNTQGTTITNVPGWTATSTSCWIVKKGATTC